MLFKLLKAASLLMCLTLVFSACSSDKDDTTTPSGTHKVTYKLIGSNDVNITTIAYYNGGTSPVTKTGNFGSTWTSEEVTAKNSYILISANGLGNSDNSTLKAQIIENEKVVKESGVSTGKTLTTMVSYE